MGYCYFYDMVQLFALNKTVYDQIKSDRQILIDRIKASQVLLDELDTVFPILDSVFNPKIKISETKTGKESSYTGTFTFLLPDGTPSKKHQIPLGKTSDFKGIDDKSLMDKAISMAQKRIKDECPEYFK
jgi:hypothetical protein